MKKEQHELSKSKKFWQLVAKWRKQPRYSQEEVDRILELDDQPSKAPRNECQPKPRKPL